MIRLRLTSRAQLVLAQGLAILSEAKRAAIKANDKAYSSTGELREELLFINGDGNESEGLVGLIAGRQPELNFGGEHDEKLDVLDTLETGFSLDELFAAMKLLQRAQQMAEKFTLAAPDLLVTAHDRLESVAAEMYSAREVERQLQLADAEAAREKTPQEIADEAEAQAADELAAKRRKKALPPTLDEAIAEEDAAEDAENAAPDATGDELDDLGD